MEKLMIPGEHEIKQWVKEAVNECLEGLRNGDGRSDHLQEPLLSRKEIVRYLDNITLVTLHAWMKKGLPHHKQGGRVYFMKSEVLAYIKGAVK